MKILGIIILILSCGGLGNIWASANTNRTKELGEVLQVLAILETEIIYGQTPLPEAFQKMSQSLNPKSGLVALLNDVAEAMKDENYDYNGITDFKKIIKQNAYLLALNEGDLETLATLGFGLGLSTQEDQIRRLRLVFNNLETRYQMSREQAKTYNKIYQTTGWAVGIILTLFMI